VGGDKQPSPTAEDSAIRGPKPDACLGSRLKQETKAAFDRLCDQRRELKRCINDVFKYGWQHNDCREMVRFCNQMGRNTLISDATGALGIRGGSLKELMARKKMKLDSRSGLRTR
jgi:hypothetical protein